MHERFISEAIEPMTDFLDASEAAIGEPAFPTRFKWREKEYTVEEVLDKRKETSSDTHGSKESYLRKHWFTVRTTDGHQMKIYFERQPRSKTEAVKRWWLYTIAHPLDTD